MPNNCQMKKLKRLLGQIFLKLRTYFKCSGLQQAISFDSPKKITNLPKIPWKMCQPLLMSYKNTCTYQLVYVDNSLYQMFQRKTQEALK